MRTFPRANARNGRAATSRFVVVCSRDDGRRVRYGAYRTHGDAASVAERLKGFGIRAGVVPVAGHDAFSSEDARWPSNT